MNSKYINYNACTVTLNGSKPYVITNIQTKGLPGKDCGAHLESLSIKSSVVGSGNPNDYAASGRITVVDFKNSIFDVLRGRLVDYLNNSKNNSYLPTVNIHIDTFTGSRDWNGWVQDWQYTFVGTTPSISIDWTSLPPNGAIGEALPTSAEYTSPKSLIEALQKAFPSVGNDIPVVSTDGTDISGNLVFTDGKITFDIGGLASSKSALLDGYRFVISKSTLDGKAISPGEVRTVDGKSQFVVIFSEAENNTSTTKDTSDISKIVFVQNGSLKYYTQRSDGKWVIPMTSFNFSAKLSNMTLQSRVLYNINGNTVQNLNNGSNSTQTPDAPTETTLKTAAATGASGIETSFDCYNTMIFSSNNLAEPINYEVYDEFGKKHVVSGSGTVKEVSYDLQGGVVKASVTCAEYFNKADTISQDTGSPTSSVAETSPNVTMQQSTKSTAGAMDREDEYTISLKLDHTESLVKNGVFTKQVTEFFDRGYGDLTGKDRLLDYDYIKNLAAEGNIGLFSLLIAVSNYGIKGYPSSWAGKDPIKEYEEFSGFNDFSASSLGKSPFDFKKGGFGLPHLDAENMGTIYKEIGFTEECAKNSSFKDILTVVTNPFTVYNKEDVNKGKQAKSYTGKVVDLKEGTYCGVKRWFPVMNDGKSYWTRFDAGLKTNTEWSNWADSTLHFRNDQGMLFQSYVFNFWIRKFWQPTIKALYKKEQESLLSSHKVCLQDAIRISRLGNSATSLISVTAGKNVQYQLERYLLHYKNNPKHVFRQWVFCRRATFILEQIYGEGIG